MSALSPRDTVLCSGTVRGVRFADRLAAARAGEFSAISFLDSDYQQARREERLSDADLRAMLADHGLRVAEIDPLLNWVPGLESSMFGASEAEFYDIAEALGARSINLALALPMPFARELLTSAFAAVCDRAANLGLLVQLEPLPWTAVPSLAVAAGIVADAGRNNGGVMLDAWHWARAGADLDAVASCGGSVNGLQLSDAPAVAEANAIAETLHRRRLPGDGAIDLAGLMRRLDGAGCTAPVGIEVFSDELARLPATEIGYRAGARLRGVLARARAASRSAGA
jgi:sugar phosphate isomerase/epimerase